MSHSYSTNHIFSFVVIYFSHRHYERALSVSRKSRVLAITSTFYNFGFSFVSESVKLLLGKHVKILLKNVVKLEIKAEKTENRVLVSNGVDTCVCT